MHKGWTRLHFFGALENIRHIPACITGFSNKVMDMTDHGGSSFSHQRV